LGTSAAGFFNRLVGLSYAKPFTDLEEQDMYSIIMKSAQRDANTVTAHWL